MWLLFGEMFDRSKVLKMAGCFFVLFFGNAMLMGEQKCRFCGLLKSDDLGDTRVASNASDIHHGQLRDICETSR